MLECDQPEKRTNITTKIKTLRACGVTSLAFNTKSLKRKGHAKFNIEQIKYVLISFRVISNKHIG
jgi:hypothetical protein